MYWICRPVFFVQDYISANNSRLPDLGSEDSAIFVVFDRETIKEAESLGLEEMSSGEEMELPKCLEDLAGNEYVFHQRVTLYNFTPDHHTFAISAINEDLLFGTQAESDNSNPPPVVDMESGQAAESASNHG
ncbi:Rep_fac-A_C domain-containing protein [Raphanus sativus]|nr:Rep_fac-A_C domain-containing protein [Raphanus sativus]